MARYELGLNVRRFVGFMIHDTFPGSSNTLSVYDHVTRRRFLSTILIIIFLVVIVVTVVVTIIAVLNRSWSTTTDRGMVCWRTWTGTTGTTPVSCSGG